MTPSEINIAVAKKLGALRKDDEGNDCIDCVPDYAGSIQAAFEIVNHFEKDREKQIAETGKSSSPIFALRLGCGGEWHCDLGDSGEAGWYQPTPSMAICLAFLKLS